MKMFRLFVPTMWIVLLSLGGGAQAAPRTWDIATGDGATITDGAGNWSTGGANWNTGAGDTTWAAGDTATIGGGTLGAFGTITLTTAITAGGITFNAPNGGGNYTVNGANTLTMANGSTITLNAPGTSTIAATMIVAGGGNTMTVNGTGDLTLGGQVGNGTQYQVIMNGTGTLTLGDNVTVVDNNNMGLTANSGTVIFNKPNSGSGHAVGANMTIAGATVKLAGSGGDQIYNGMSMVVNSGTFDFNGLSETVNNLTGTGGTVVNNGAGTSTFTVSNGSGTFAGTIVNGGGGGIMAFAKGGGGTLILTGANAYSGTTGVTGGILQIGNGGTAGAIGTGTINLGGALHFNRTDAVTLNNKISNGSVVVNSGTLTLAGADDNNSAVATVRSGATLILGKTSSGGVHSLGAGGTGLTIDSGALVKLGGSGNDQIYTQLDVVNNGTFDMGGFSEGFDGIGGTGNIINSGAGPNTLTVGENNAAGSVSGTIGGNTSLTKAGSGTLTLSGANTYSGGATLVTGGTLMLSGGPDRLPVSSSVQLYTGTTFDLNGCSQTIRWLTDNGNVINSGGTQSVLTLNLQDSGTRTLGGSISGNVRVVVKDAITKNTDVQQLSVASTFTGGLVIDNGQVRAAAESYLGAVPGAFDAQNVTLKNGGVLQNNNTYLVLNANRGIFLEAGDGVFFCGWGKDITASGAISGPGRVVKSDGGILILPVANTFTGDTVFRNPGVGTGTIRLDHAQALQYSTFDATGIGGNGTLNLNGQNAILGGLKGAGAALNNFTGAVSVGNNNQDVAFTGALAGSGSLTKIGTGTQTLAGGGITYTGVTTLDAGRLILSNTTAFVANTAPAHTITVNNGRTLEAAVTTGNTWDLGSTAGVTINGTGTLLKSGAGELQFGRSGKTVYISLSAGSLIDVQAGTLRNEYGAGNWSANQAALNIAAGATVKLWDSAITVDALTGAGTISKGQGSAHTLTLGVAGGTGTFSGYIHNGDGGTLSLTKTGVGTQTLAGTVANTFTGLTTVNGGELDLDKTAGVDAIGAAGFTLTSGKVKLLANQQIGDGAFPTVNGGTLDLNGCSETVRAISGSGGSVGNTGGSQGLLTLNLLNSGGRTFSGSVDGNVRLAVQASTTKNADVLTLAGVNTFTGGLLIDNGHVRVTADSGLGAVPGALDAANVTLQNGGVLQNNNSSPVLDANRGIYLGNGNGVLYAGWAPAQTLTINGPFSGPGNLEKRDGGALILGGASTYAGSTLITDGSIKLAGGDDRLPVTTTVQIYGGKILDLNGFNQTIRWVSDSGIVTNTAPGTSTLTMNLLSSGNRTQGSAFNGRLRIAVQNSNSKAGGGTDLMTFNVANSYTGGTLIDNGQIRAANDAYLGAVPAVFDAANITLQNGGVLQNNEAFLDLNANRGLVLGGGDGVFFCGWGLDIALNGAVSGAGRLMKSDGGWLRLNTANTFSGDTVFSTVNGAGPGGIVLNHALALQNSTFDATGIGGNGTLNLNNLSATLGGLKGAGAAINNFTGAVSLGNNNQDVTYTGTLSGSGSLTKIGTGTQVLSGGSINFTGNTTVNAGCLVFSNCTSYANGGSPADLSIGSSGVLDFNVSGTHVIGSTATTAISGTGILRKSGVGLLALDEQGNNSYVVVMGMTGGTIDIQGGAIRNGGWAGQNWTGNKAALNIAAGATFDIWDGNDARVDALTGAGTVAKNQGGGATRTLTVGVNDGSGTFSGVLQNAQTYLALAKSGAGTQVLAGTAANTHAGWTTVNAGELHLNKTPGVDAVGVGGLSVVGGTAKLLAADQISDSAALALNGGTFDLNGCNETVKLLQGNSGAVINSGGGTAVLTANLANSGTQTCNGQVNGSVRLVVANATTKNTDVQVLGGANTFTGGLVIDNGQVRVATETPLGGLPAIPEPAHITLKNSGVLQNFDSYLTISVNRGIFLEANDGVFYTGWNKDITVNSAISGPGRLVKSDGGRLLLAGANTFTGDTVFRTPGVGTIRLDHALALQNSTFDATGIGGNGILDLNGLSATLGGLKGAGATINNFTGAVSVGNNNQDVAFTGTLTGAGSLAKIGTGTQTLSGGNINYTGATTVNDGKLVLTNTTNLARGTLAQTFTVNSGRTLEIALGSTWNVGTPAGVTFNGAGTILKSGTGELQLGRNGMPVYVSLAAGSLVDVQAGTLRNEYMAGNWSANQASLNIAGGATVKLWDSAITVDALTGAGTISKGQNNTHALTLGVAGGTGAFSGNIHTADSGAINLVKTGAGNQTLSGVLSHGGTTSANQGILTLAGTLANTMTGMTTANASGELDLNKTAGVNAIGPGGLTLAGGTVKLLAHEQLDNAAALTINSGSFDLNGCEETIRYLQGTGGSVINSGATTGTLRLNLLNSGDRTLGAAISGDVRLAVLNTTTKNGDVLTLNTVNTFSGGLLVDNGQARVASDNYLGAVPGAFDADNIVLRNSGILQNNDSFLTINANRGILLESGDGVFYAGWGKDITVNSAISGTGRLVKSDGGQLILTVASTFTGDTVFRNPGVGTGTIRLDHALALQNSTFDATGIAANGTLNLNGQNAVLGGLKGAGATIQNLTGQLSVGNNNQSTTYTGALTGTGGFRKTGTGTLTLALNPGYNGTTTVDGGTLLVNGNHTTGAAYTVNAGTLGGNGTLGSAVHVGPAGTLAPAGTNTVAQWRLNGNVEFNEGATLAVDLQGYAPGTEYDQIVNAGAGELRLNNATLVVSVPDGFKPPTDTSFTICTGFANRTGQFKNKPEGGEILAGGKSYAIHYGPGSAVTLTVRDISFGTQFIMR